MCGRGLWGAGGGGGGNERHGALSNSPPLLMAQLHHYLAHTLGPNRLRDEEKEDDRQVYQTKYKEGGGGLLPSIHCRVDGTERKKPEEEKEERWRGQTSR